MSETEKKRRAPKTIAAIVATSIPALVTGYLNHLEDQTSRAALVNESIRLEQKIDRLESKLDQRHGFEEAAALFGLGLIPPAVVDSEPSPAAALIVIEEEPYHPSIAEQTFGIPDEPDELTPPEVVTTTRTPLRPAMKKRQPPRGKFKKRYDSLF